ncbi:hypothetical protein [Streptomyces sp. NPDC058745]|uniref:hypothetical protein n=1 Tax=unclassified Streptomyces TaxID=2593676 RepID=UPI00367C3484
MNSPHRPPRTGSRRPRRPHRHAWAVVVGYAVHVVVSALFPALMSTRVVGHLSVGLCLMGALAAAMGVALVRSGRDDRPGSPDADAPGVTAGQERWT